MLTEILDHWEILRELLQQQASWQQRWDQAFHNFQTSLETLDPGDAQRLQAVLIESLSDPRPAGAMLPGSAFPAAAAPASAQGQIPRQPENRPKSEDATIAAQAASEPPDAPGAEQANSGPSDTEPSTVEVDSPPAVAASGNENTPGERDAGGDADRSAEPPTPTADPMEDLLQWATETIGDGVSENELFQALRKSPFAAKASDLFKILESRDAFYDTDDGDIHVRSLRPSGSLT